MRITVLLASLLALTTSLGVFAQGASAPRVTKTDSDQSARMARHVAMCKRNLASIQDPFERWVTELFKRLCAASDADSLLAGYIITLPGMGSHGESDIVFLQRAYAAGPSNASVLWLTALTSQCTNSVGAADCNLALVAAKALVHVDADNGLAWLTLAFVASESDGPTALEALKRAGAAPRMHDYTFDLMKLALQAVRTLPIPPAAISKAQVSEELQLQLVETVVMMPGVLDGWFRNDSVCGSHPGHPMDANREQLCKPALDLFKRGDSEFTLSGNPDALKAIRTNQQIAHSKSPSDYAKASVNAYLHAHNGREFWNMVAVHDAAH